MMAASQAQHGAFLSARGGSDNMAAMGFLGALVESMEEDLDHGWWDGCRPVRTGTEDASSQSGEDIAQELIAQAHCFCDAGSAEPVAKDSVAEQEQEEDEIPELAAAHISGHEFEARMIKKPGESLGLSVNIVGDALLIQDCFEEGLAGSWNSMSTSSLQLKVWDKIISCNGNADPSAMLSCIAQGGSCAIRLRVLRGPFSPPTPASPSPSAVIPHNIFDDSSLADEDDRAKAAELEAKRDASRAEYERRQHEKTKVNVSQDKGDLQRLLAERLAKSRGT